MRAKDEAKETQLPERIYLGTHCAWSLDHAFHDREVRGEGERLLSFVLPPFQRPPVWTRRQSIAFMESLILGLPVGTYTYCTSFDVPKTDGWLLDGQQRMRAIKQFLEDEISVFGIKWSQLENRDRLRILNVGFGAYVLKEASEAECLERYLKLNYSGTPHTEVDKRRAQRAKRQLITTPPHPEPDDERAKRD